MAMPSEPETQARFANDIDAIERDFGRRLLTPAELSGPAGARLSAIELAGLRESDAWIRDVILRRVKKSETRTESVCPFVKPSIDAGLFYYAVGNPRDPADLDSLADEVRHFGDLFQRVAPSSGPLAMLRCIVLVLPQTPHSLILRAVDPARSSVETELLERGVMVGEFSRECPFPATWDASFFPLQSPVPFYVFRAFLKTDWRLIHRVKPWRAIYKRHFGEPSKGDQHKFPAVLGWYAERAAARARRLFNR